MTGLTILLAASLLLPENETVRTDCFLGKEGSMPSVVAGAELTRTATALVVRVRQRLPDGRRPQARGTAYPPESMFAGGGDTVEVALAPHADDPSAYYHFIANPSNELYLARGRDTSWRPSAPIAAQSFFEANGWGVDFTVPYAAFGLVPPEDGDVWRANFAVGACSWSGAADYHDPSRFGHLTFGGRPAAAFVESAERAEDGMLRVTFAIPPRTAAGGEIPHKGADETYDLELVAGRERLAGFRSFVASNEPGYLKMDRYYHPAGESLTVSYAAAGFVRGTVRVRRLDDSAPVAEFVDQAGSGAVGLGVLPPAEYALEVDDGCKRVSGQFEVLATAVAGADAGPHYPIVGSEKVTSAYCSFRPALPCHYVRTQPSGFLYDGVGPLRGAERLLAGGMDGRTIHRLGYETQLRALVRNEDGVPTPVEDNPAFFAETYRTLKDAYPNLRFSIHVDSPARAEAYAAACDVFEYAHPLSSYAHDLPMRLRDGVAVAKRIGGSKPTFFWLGASVPENGRFRTAEELNLAIRYCVLQGLAGNVLHLGHGGVSPSNLRLWSFLRDCERAVNAWYPFWAEGEPADCCVNAEGDVIARFRTGAAGSVLLAVNFSRRERSFSYEDPASGVRTAARLPGYGSLAKMWRKVR